MNCKELVSLKVGKKYDTDCCAETSALSQRPWRLKIKKSQRHPIVLTSVNCMKVCFCFFSSAPLGLFGSGWFLRNPPLIVLLVLCWSLSCGASMCQKGPGASQHVPWKAHSPGVLYSIHTLVSWLKWCHGEDRISHRSHWCCGAADGTEPWLS